MKFDSSELSFAKAMCPTSIFDSAISDNDFLDAQKMVRANVLDRFSIPDLVWHWLVEIKCVYKSDEAEQRKCAEKIRSLLKFRDAMDSTEFNEAFVFGVIDFIERSMSLPPAIVDTISDDPDIDLSVFDGYLLRVAAQYGGDFDENFFKLFNHPSIQKIRHKIVPDIMEDIIQMLPWVEEDKPDWIPDNQSILASLSKMFPEVDLISMLNKHCPLWITLQYASGDLQNAILDSPHFDASSEGRDLLVYTIKTSRFNAANALLNNPRVRSYLSDEEVDEFRELLRRKWESDRSRMNEYTYEDDDADEEEDDSRYSSEDVLRTVYSADNASLLSKLFTKACMEGDTSLVMELLNNSNVDPTVCRNAPIRLAMNRGNWEIVDIIKKYLRIG